MMSVAKYFKEGAKDDWDYPVPEGWYFYGEDDGATRYGPYANKELCENAFIRYCRDLDRKDLEDYNNSILKGDDDATS
jgi:hypothetical protein